jgi:3-dehydroquinate synthetase
VTAAMQGVAQDITIDRDVASAGWFLTRNIMLKAEYVHQDYKNYASTNLLNGGKFYGTMLEASIAF